MLEQFPAAVRAPLTNRRSRKRESRPRVCGPAFSDNTRGTETSRSRPHDWTAHRFCPGVGFAVLRPVRARRDVVTRPARDLVRRPNAWTRRLRRGGRRLTARGECHGSGDGEQEADSHDGTLDSTERPARRDDSHDHPGSVSWTSVAKRVPEHRPCLWYRSPAGPERQSSAGSALSCSSISRSSRGSPAELATPRAWTRQMRAAPASPRFAASVASCIRHRTRCTGMSAIVN